MAILFTTKLINTEWQGSQYPATLLEIEIEEGICEPSDLSKLNPPDVAGSKGLVVSGRCPIWLFAFLTHHYHVTQWVATFDPRLNGAVVVSTHARNVPTVGEVVSLPKSE